MVVPLTLVTSIFSSPLTSLSNGAPRRRTPLTRLCGLSVDLPPLARAETGTWEPTPTPHAYIIGRIIIKEVMLANRVAKDIVIVRHAFFPLPEHEPHKKSKVYQSEVGR